MALGDVFAAIDRTEQRGDAVAAMRNAETVLAQQQSTAAAFDREVIDALLHAHETTEDGGRRLDDLAEQVEQAARRWDLGTAVGARELQRFLVGKLREIVAVVHVANDDDASKQALAAAWAALYAGQSEPDPAPAAGAADSPRTPAGPLAEAFPDAAADPYLDGLPAEDSDPLGVRRPEYGAPALPGWGAGMPGFGAMPAGGIPEQLPPAGSWSGLQHRLPTDADPQRSDDVAVDEPPPEEVQPDASGAAAADDPAQPTPGAGSVTATLPDGETITAATPQLAAVIQAAADGVPVADAFRRQGIGIPPPGTPVPAPLDQSQLRPGDLGVFTDRYALAAGHGKALLDGEIHRVENLHGPGFLGWQHPPTVGETPAGETTQPGEEPAPTPAPTGLSAPVGT